MLAAILTGCTAVGPDYTPTKPDVPQRWHTPLTAGLTSEPVKPEVLAHWWRTLRDPELTSLEERAVKGNLDVKTAKARVREARALRGVARAAFFPFLDASGAAKKDRTSENSTPGAGGAGELYSAGFDAGWELDVFGGTRRAVDAAQATLEATREDMHGVLVSLLAEVALNYVDVRTYQARLAVVEANINVQQDTYDLNVSRHKAGLVDELAVQQSRYNLEHTRSLVPTLEAGIDRAMNRVAVLLGAPPRTLHKELTDSAPVPTPPRTVAVSIPVEAVRHRPDVRAAERRLAAAFAQTGVAKAELYPKFHLLGAIGLESFAHNDFLKWSSRTWSIGPGVSWDLLHAGALRKNVEASVARQQQTLTQYQSTILRSLEEAENALTAYGKEQKRRDTLILAVNAARRADQLARDRYQAGLVDFNDVLDAQRSLLAFQDELAQSNGAVTANLVRLYKALGGGWTARDEDPPRASAKKGRLTP